MKRIGSTPTYIYGDGGCRANHLEKNIGGYGVHILFPDGKTLESCGYEYNTTNNIMELTACTEALKMVQDKESPVIVTSDSMYVIKGITEWCVNWIKNDWISKKGEPIANKEVWLKLISEVHKFKDIKFIHCKGHADNIGNNRADELANKAMDLAEENMKI